MIDATTGSAIGVAVASTVTAFIQTLRANKTAKKTEEESAVVSEAKAWQAKAVLMQTMKDDYQALLEKEYTAHQATREYWHAKSTEFQLELSKCNDKCAELQSRTDITKIETLILKLGDAMTVMADGMKRLLETLNHK